MVVVVVVGMTSVGWWGGDSTGLRVEHGKTHAGRTICRVEQCHTKSGNARRKGGRVRK